MSRPARILAVIASALLGVGGGVATALLLLDTGTPGVDPLNLGVPMVDQSCTQKFLVVTAVGASGSALGPGITPDPDHARYLRVADSCPAAWRPHGTVESGYAAYLGPYDNGLEACAERLRVRSSFVTQLHEGSQQGVQCLCFLPQTSLPTLTPGSVVDVADRVYVRALVDLLKSSHRLPDAYVFSGSIDPALVRAVKQVQQAATLPETGVVDVSTWQRAINKGCLHLR